MVRRWLYDGRQQAVGRWVASCGLPERHVSGERSTTTTTLTFSIWHATTMEIVPFHSVRARKGSSAMASSMPWSQCSFTTTTSCGTAFFEIRCIGFIDMVWYDIGYGITEIAVEVTDPKSYCMMSYLFLQFMTRYPVITNIHLKDDRRKSCR